MLALVGGDGRLESRGQRPIRFGRRQGAEARREPEDLVFRPRGQRNETQMGPQPKHPMVLRAASNERPSAWSIHSPCGPGNISLVSTRRGTPSSRSSSSFAMGTARTTCQGEPPWAARIRSSFVPSLTAPPLRGADDVQVRPRQPSGACVGGPDGTGAAHQVAERGHLVGSEPAVVDRRSSPPTPRRGACGRADRRCGGAEVLPLASRALAWVERGEHFDAASSTRRCRRWMD
jgi:hypothetical protein